MYFSCNYLWLLRSLCLGSHHLLAGGCHLFVGGGAEFFREVKGGGQFFQWAKKGGDKILSVILAQFLLEYTFLNHFCDLSLYHIHAILYNMFIYMNIWSDFFSTPGHPYMNLITALYIVRVRGDNLSS